MGFENSPISVSFDLTLLTVVKLPKRDARQLEIRRLDPIQTPVSGWLTFQRNGATATATHACGLHPEHPDLDLPPALVWGRPSFFGERVIHPARGQLTFGSLGRPWITRRPLFYLKRALS